MEQDENAGVSSADDRLAYTCPQCQNGICLPESPPGGLIDCPECGAQFFASVDEEDPSADPRANAQELADRERREGMLSELRIRQIATLRRSLLRTRGHLIVGAAVCGGTALMLASEAAKYGWKIYAEHFSGHAIPALAYVVTALFAAGTLLMFFPVRFFLRRARRIDRELAETVQADPTTPPDFSTLGGVEFWKKLEEMHEQGDDAS